MSNEVDKLLSKSYKIVSKQNVPTKKSEIEKLLTSTINLSNKLENFKKNFENKKLTLNNNITNKMKN